jgi:hypothetical protein
MIDHKAAALEELCSERDALVAQAHGLRAELGEIEARVDELNTVIVPLEALVSGTTSRHTAAANDAVADDVTGLRTVSTSPVPEINDQPDVPEVFRRYLPRGGEGKRLRSTLMVSDIVDMIGEPVTKETLRCKFFGHFGRDNLARFWASPDNALNTAINRAIEEELITKVPGVDGRAALYTGHFRDSETGRPAMPAIYVEGGN